MNSKSIIMLVTGLIVLAAVCSLSIASEKQMVIFDKPVKIMATNIDDSVADEAHYHLRMNITSGADRYRFNSLIFLQNSDLKKAIEYQKSRIRWYVPYLMVGWERGGGNASRGYLDAVFILKKRKLIYLGEVDADSLENGFFKDWYDKFELNELTSHAESPIIRLVMEEKNGRFVVDLEKTWTENQKRFNDNKRIITYIQEKEKIKSEARASQIAGPLLFNAVLGKYCKHDKDMLGFVETVKSELDKERLRLFSDIISRVIPGELPKAVIEIRKY